MEISPQDLIQQIQDYIPRDKDMTSSSAKCIHYMLNYFNNYTEDKYLYERDPYEPDYNQDIDYTSFPDYETFSEYALRINRAEMKYYKSRRYIFNKFIESDSEPYSDTDTDSDSDSDSD